jgi:hypothetical protein
MDADDAFCVPGRGEVVGAAAALQPIDRVRFDIAADAYPYPPLTNPDLSLAR